ncbi:MAG: glycerophosphodiester phosphodiesterase [Clostridiales bacterium]|nr:glycerophosphodiester phosphodiesterase [Clostridiales bacterium]
MKRTIIVAHSGCEGTVPGSLEYILTALKWKADFIEVDLRLYDGEIYLAHDPIDVNRLDTYLTFRHVLELVVPEKIGLNCDLKEKEVFEPVLRLLREYGMEERTVFTGEYWVETDRKAKYKYYLNTTCSGIKSDAEIINESDADRMIYFYNNSKDQAFDAFNLDYRNITNEAEKKLFDAGVRFCFWTVDNLKEIERMLKDGVYAITTNLLSEAISARLRIQDE